MSSRPTPRTTRSAGWLDASVAPPPTVLVLGGFLTAPPLYRRFVRRLLRRGAAAVVVSNVWTPDWLLGVGRGLASVTGRSGRALLEAVALSADVSSGAPLLVVGHSAGGLVARLLTAPEPFPGRRFGARRSIGALVTLGTPHVVAASTRIGGRIHLLSAAVADAVVPGAHYAPAIGYVSVGSTAVAGDPAGSGRERVAYRLYRSIAGSRVTAGARGDGLVPLVAALLGGAVPVVLEDVVHGPASGEPWYGTDEALDVWWPVALAAWREALAWRATEAARHGETAAPAAQRDGPADPMEATG